MTDPHTHEGVGEVWGAPRNYNGAKPIPGPKRDHVCGTAEEHGSGGIYDPSRPAMIYQPSGLPLCCEPARREAALPVAVGVSSVTYRDDPYRSSITTAVLIDTQHIRERVHRAYVCVCSDAVYSQTARVDPYRSTVCACVVSVSQVTAHPVYRSTVRVGVEVESDAETTGAEFEFCPVANGIAPYEGYSVTPPPGNAEQWHFIQFFNGPGPFRLSLVNTGPSDIEFLVYEGPDCDSLESRPIQTLGTCQYYEAVGGSVLWVRARNLGFDWSYSIVVIPEACPPL